MDIVSKLRGHPIPPSCKRSRNLITLTSQIQDYIDKSRNSGNELNLFKDISNLPSIKGWQSLSYLSFQIDYRNGSQLLRTHTADYHGAHYYDLVSFPTCVKMKNTPEMKLGGNKAKLMYQAMSEFLTEENYLMKQNRLFNYKLRNTECVKFRNCTFPNATEITIEDGSFYALFYLLPIVASFIIGGLIELCMIVYSRRRFNNKVQNADESRNSILDEVEIDSFANDPV